MTKIILLGTGGPRPDPQRQGAAVLVQIGADNLLFDAGRGATQQLVRAGLQPESLRAIFLTHHHFDHTGSLADLLLSAWNNSGGAPPPVYGPKGTRRIVTTLLDDLYAADIMTRLAEAAGDEVMGDVRKLAQASDVSPGVVAETDRWRVKAERVDHMHGLGIGREAWDCYGYRLEAEGKVIAISGDTVPCEGLTKLAQDADVLIQCCYMAAAEMESPETHVIPKYIIACSHQVGKVAADAGVATLVLTHFRQKTAAMMDSLANDVKADFDGRLILGRDLLAIDV
jgi:ribonuclease Z